MMLQSWKIKKYKLFTNFLYDEILTKNESAAGKLALKARLWHKISYFQLQYLWYSTLAIENRKKLKNACASSSEKEACQIGIALKISLPRAIFAKDAFIY